MNLLFYFYHLSFSSSFIRSSHKSLNSMYSSFLLLDEVCEEEELLLEEELCDEDDEELLLEELCEEADELLLDEELCDDEEELLLDEDLSSLLPSLDVPPTVEEVLSLRVPFEELLSLPLGVPTSLLAPCSPLCVED